MKATYRTQPYPCTPSGRDAARPEPSKKWRNKSPIGKGIRRRLAGLVAAVLACGGIAAHAASFPSAVVPDGVGVNTGASSNTLDAQDFTMMQDADIGTIRVRCAWPDVEKTYGGAYDWTKLDALAAKLATYGVKPIYILAYVAPGYNTDGITMNEPQERQGFANFCAAAVARYDQAGVIWEIWNEQNSDKFWDASTPGNTPTNARERAVNYMAMVDLAAPAMKAAKPNCTIVSGGVLDIGWAVTKAWFDECFIRGLLTKVDGLGVHTYGGPSTNKTPERAISQLVDLRNEIVSYGGSSDFPILQTEYGTALAEFTGTTLEKETQQAQANMRMYFITHLTGLKLNIWYEWQSGGDMAMVQSSGTPRVSYAAADVMTAQLSGYSFERQVAGCTASDFVLIFKNGNNRKLVVWTGTSSHTLPISVSSASGSFATVSMTGGTGSVSVQSNTISPSLTGAPLYIDLGTANATGVIPNVWGDVGVVGVAGSTSVSGGVYTVNASGGGITFANDRFHFVYQMLASDGEIIARVPGVPSISTGRAGVMMRETLLNTGKHISTLLTSTRSAQFSRRSTLAGQAVHTTNSSAAYQWVRVSRYGDEFTSYASTDGTNWIEIGSETIAMAETLYVGVAVTSGSNNVLTTAQADNLEIVTATPLISQDVGNPGVAGSATESGGVYTINASGSGIQYAQDRFHFLYQSVDGDAEIIARVASLPAGSGAARRVGVMMRETLDGNTRHASTLIQPDQDVEFRRRSAPATQSTETVNGSSNWTWVRMVRSGNTFSSYASTNGTSWTLVGSESISMTSTIYAGMAVTSGVNATLSQAQLADLNIVP